MCTLQSIRILIVTHAPLSPEMGAGQMALNLAEAFREQGHNVTLWSPQPLPEKTRWWQTIQQMRSKLDTFIETQKSFDVIDSPAILITQKVSKSALVVVARSVQPDILYLLYGVSSQRKSSIKDHIKYFSYYLYLWSQMFLVLQGWRKAKYILCLGSLELDWMKKWFPWWKGKLIYYVNALSKADQTALAKVRQDREKNSGDSIRFLWIGRWVAHKGTEVLLDFIVKWVAIRPQDTFTIAGCGTCAEKDFPPELLHSSRVTILPSFERSQLYSLLANNDIGLFTSRVEGWGLVLNEMLESGMPVFATPVGGVPELQPFFIDILKPFPPPLQSREEIIKIHTFMEDYYEVFSWKKISETYAHSLFTNLDYHKRG